MRIATPIALTTLAIAGATVDAHAERRDCEVAFVRAPEAARLVIESWLAKEPRCSGSIELRVIETESGSLYLIAQRPDGRIHEREVPDAQSAGVLVASWVADDWTSSPGVAEEALPPPVPLESAAPGTTSTVVASSGPSAAPRGVGRWLSLGAMAQMHGQGGAGLRLDVDLFGARNGSKWTFGAAFVGARTQMDAASPYGEQGWIQARDLRLLATVARTFTLSDDWSLRGSAGVGPMYTEADAVVFDVSSPYMEYGGTTVSIGWEASLLLSREILNHRWALTFGSTATMIGQSFDTDAAGPESMRRSQLQVMVLAGARYRL